MHCKRHYLDYEVRQTIQRSHVILLLDKREQSHHISSFGKGGTGRNLPYGEVKRTLRVQAGRRAVTQAGQGGTNTP